MSVPIEVQPATGRVVRVHFFPGATPAPTTTSKPGAAPKESNA